MGALPRAKRRKKTIGGTPCGRPSLGRTPREDNRQGRPLWVPFPGPNAERSQSAGAPLVGALRRAITPREATPCGCPSKEDKGHPLWVPFAGHTAERSQSVGAPLVGALLRAKNREKPIGRGAPCGCPSQGIPPREANRQGHPLLPFPGPNAERRLRGTPCGALLKANAERRQSVGAPLVGALLTPCGAKRREKTIGRGTPCGCPSPGQTPKEDNRGHPLWAPLPGQNAERRQLVGAPLVGALRRLFGRPN